MKFRVLAILSLIVLMTSCKKNQLKKPAEVQFRIVMDSPVNPVNVNHLTFSSGYINLKKIIIDGDRVEGESVSFTREFSSGLQVNLNGNTTTDDLKFDIPQGTFTSLEVVYETFNQGTELAINIEGVYTDLSQTNIPFKFEFDAVEDFPLAAIEGGSNQIVLDKDVAESPTISLNPGYWFQNVSINLWENANLYNVDGVQTIQINTERNEEIYDEVVDYIEESGELLFE